MPTPSISKAAPESVICPDFITHGGTRLREAHASYFAQTTNDNTNRTYANGVKLFFDFIAEQGISDLLDIEPRNVTGFIAMTQENDYEVMSIRLYLSAIRMFLDYCVVEGLLAVNPAKAVKLPRYSSQTGKTPVIVPAQVRDILDAIPLETQADYRDRALIGTMVFSFFRISAALSLRVKDYEMRGAERWIIGQEKGSKRHEMPVHPTLETMLDEYLSIAELKDGKAPLFQSGTPRGGKLTGRPFDRTSAWRMVRRRAKAANIHREIGNHSFRATGITTYLNAGGTLEDARIMANHSNSTTTKLYDRTDDIVKVREVNRIKI